MSLPPKNSKNEHTMKIATKSGYFVLFNKNINDAMKRLRSKPPVEQ
jgi:hypothetical protein